jgi:hypothetical protein
MSDYKFPSLDELEGNAEVIRERLGGTQEIEGITPDEYRSALEDYNVASSSSAEAMLNQRAENQSWQEQAFNAGAKILPNAAFDFAKNMVTLGDLDSFVSPDGAAMMDNDLYNALDEYQKEMNEEFFPIYRTSPNETFDLSDSAWWFDGFSNTASSALGFIASSYVTGAALDGITKGLAGVGGIFKYANQIKKGGDIAKAFKVGASQIRKGSQLLDTAQKIVNTAASVHMEGFGVGAETGKAVYELALSQGKTEEEAKSLAANAAASAYGLNRANFILNYTSAGAFTGGYQNTRKLFNQITAKSALKNIAFEGIQEAAEENINHIAQKYGESTVKGTSLGDYLKDGMLKDATSAEAFESMFWGAIGGIAQTTGSQIGDNFAFGPFGVKDGNKKISKKEFNNKKFLEQKKAIDATNVIAKATGNVPPLNAMKNIMKQSELLEKHEKATKEGELDKAKKIEQEILIDQALFAFQNGTTESLVEMYESIENGEAQEWQDNNPQSENYYKKKAKEARESILKWEDSYNDASKYLNDGEVFQNLINQQLLEPSLNEAKVKAETANAKIETEVIKKQAELTEKLTKAQDEFDSTDFTNNKDATSLDDAFNIVEGVTTGEDINRTKDEAEVSPQDRVKRAKALKKLNKAKNEYNKFNPDEYRKTVKLEDNEQNSINDLNLLEEREKTLKGDYKELVSLKTQNELLENEKKIQKEYDNRIKEDKKKEEINKTKSDQLKDAADTTDVPEPTGIPDAAKAGNKTTKKQKNQSTTVPTVFTGQPSGDPTQTMGEPSGQPTTVVTTQGGPTQGIEQNQGDPKTTPNVNTFSKDKNGQIVKNKKDAAKKVINDNNSEIYPNSTNEEVNKISEEVNNENKKHVDRPTSDNEGSNDGRTTYAPNRAAYLVRPWEFDADNNKVDINNELDPNYDPDIELVEEGTVVKVKLLSDGDPYQENNGEVITFGTWKKNNQYTGEGYGIFIDGKPTPSAMLHDEKWINELNVKADPNELEEQKKQLRALRESIKKELDEGKTEVELKVGYVTQGFGFKNAGNEWKSADEALSDDNIQLAIVRDNKFQNSKGNSIDTEDIHNGEELKKYPGITVALLKSNVIDGVQKYIAVPLKRKKIKDNDELSVTIDEIFNAFENKQKFDGYFTGENDEIDLINLLGNFVYINNDESFNIANAPNDTTVLHFKNNKLSFFTNGQMTNPIEVDLKNIDETKFDLLKKQIKTATFNVKFNDGLNSNVKVVKYDSNEGLVTVTMPNSKLIKQNTESQYSTPKVGDKYVHTIQKGILFDIADRVNDDEESQEESVQQTTVEKFSKDQGKYKLKQTVTSDGIINQTVKNTENNSEITKTIKPDGSVNFFFIGEFEGVPEGLKGLASNAEQEAKVLEQLDIEAKEFLSLPIEQSTVEEQLQEIPEPTVVVKSNTNQFQQEANEALGKEDEQTQENIKKSNENVDNSSVDDLLFFFDNPLFLIDVLDTFSKENEELTKLFKLPGLNINQSHSLVNAIVYEINENITDKAVPFDSIVKNKRYQLSLIADKLRGAGHVQQAEILDNLVNESFDKVKELVMKQLSSVSDVQFIKNKPTAQDREQDESDKIEENEEGVESIVIDEADNMERTRFDDDISIRTDAKSKISSKLKRFLGTVKSGEKIMSFDLPMSFDEVWQTLQGELVGTSASLSEQLSVLTEAENRYPWMRSVIEKLEEARDNNETDKINQFVTRMATHNVKMVQVLITKDRDGKYSFNTVSANHNSIGKSIHRIWSLSLQDSQLYDVAEEEGELELNSELAEQLINKVDTLYSFKETQGLKDELAKLNKRLRERQRVRSANNQKGKDTVSEDLNEEIEKVTEKIQEQGNQIDDDSILAWLSNVGIKISPSTLNQIKENGLRYSGSRKTFEQLFEKGGLFVNIKENLIKANKSTLSDFNPLDDQSVKQLAVLEAKNNPQYFSNNFKNIDGNTIQSFAINKQLTDRVKNLKDDKRGLLTELSEVPFSMFDTNEYNRDLYQSWNSMLYHDEVFREAFDYFYTDGLDLTNETNGQKAVNKQSKREQEISRINLFFSGQEKDNRRKVMLPFLTTSDKKTMHSIQTLAYDVSLKENIEDGDVISDDTVELVYQAMVRPELRRMQDVIFNGGIGVKGYDQGSSQFLFMPFLNDIIYEDGEIKTNLETDEIREQILEGVRQYLNSELNNTLTQWKDLGIAKVFTTGEMDEKLSNVIDGKYATYLTNNKKSFVDGSNRSTTFAALDYMVNSMVANANMYQMFASDIAMYYKSNHWKSVRNRLMSEAIANNDTDLRNEINKYKREDVLKYYETSDWVQESKDTFDNAGKRLAAEIAPGINLAKNVFSEEENAFYNNYRQIYLKDRESSSRFFNYYAKLLDGKSFDDKAWNKINEMEDSYDKDMKMKKFFSNYPNSAPYFNIEGTDAQEFTTFKEHLSVLVGKGSITKARMKELMTAERKGMLTQQDLKDSEVLQPMKPVHAGNSVLKQNNIARADVRTYIKSSSFPLVRQFFAGRELNKLREFMENNNIQRASFGTAVKVGNSTNAVKMFDSEGRVDLDNVQVIDNIEDGVPNVATLSRDNFRIQLEVPYKKDKNEVNDGSQQRSLLFGNIKDVTGFVFEGRELSATELEREYLDRYERLYLNEKAKLYDELTVDGKLDMTKIQKVLIQSAEDNGWSEYEIKALALEERDGKLEFVIPLHSSLSGEKIQYMINSIVDSRIRKQKINGNSFVLGSEEGFQSQKLFEDMTDEEKKAIIPIGDHDTSQGLRPMRIENGVVQPAEVYMPMKLRINGKLVKAEDLVDSSGRIDPSLIDESTLEMFGFRIPTQGLNSMGKMKVVGFVNSKMGDLLIAPREFTIQMGSDFDVDKLYAYIHTVEMKEGKIVKKSYPNINQEVSNFIEKELGKSIEEICD